MSPIKRCLVLIGTLSLFACDQPAQPPKPVSAPSVVTPAAETAPAPEAKAEPAKPAASAAPPSTKLEKVIEPEPPRSEPAEQAKAEPQAEPKSEPKAELKHEPKPLTITLPPKDVQAKAPAKSKLDLRLKPNVFDPLQPVPKTEIATEGLLPPLFGEKSHDDSPFQINGKLITNDQQRGDYWDSVEGAQLNFEFKQ